MSSTTTFSNIYNSSYIFNFLDNPNFFHSDTLTSFPYFCIKLSSNTEFYICRINRCVSYTGYKTSLQSCTFYSTNNGQGFINGQTRSYYVTSENFNLNNAASEGLKAMFMLYDLDYRNWNYTTYSDSSDKICYKTTINTSIVNLTNIVSGKYTSMTISRNYDKYSGYQSRNHTLATYISNITMYDDTSTSSMPTYIKTFLLYFLNKININYIPDITIRYQFTNKTTAYQNTGSISAVYTSNVAYYSSMITCMTSRTDGFTKVSYNLLKTIKRSHGFNYMSINM